NAEIKRLFPAEMEILAEPGRFLVATAAASVARIIGKAVRDGKTCYYIDDSVYHTFSGIIFDHCQYHLKAFRKGPTEVSAVFGQTCDGLDTISQSEELPDLAIEDLVYAGDIGAYSNASATWFNGFAPAQVVHINE
ncbi:MAG: type III PLP-dependent enzyme, partial [Acidobacteria bacterium]|nr:type III PLP-dependent enzyme [Acidobacteriota bacterium]